MGCKIGQCNTTSTSQGIFIVKTSLEGWPIKAKETPSPHEVRLTLVDTNPVFQSLRSLKSNLNMRTFVTFKKDSLYASY